MFTTNLDSNFRFFCILFPSLSVCIVKVIVLLRDNICDFWDQNQLIVFLFTFWAPGPDNNIGTGADFSTWKQDSAYPYLFVFAI